jgi:hypothetical protein
MTIEARYELFGDPSESLAAEAVWSFRERYGDWPLMPEAVEELTKFSNIDKADAEERIAAALLAEEIHPQIRGGGAFFGLRIDDATADRIARRYIDLTMPRKDEAERW